MTTQEIMTKLESMSDAKRLKSYVKYDERYNGCGVMMGELRKLAKTLGKDHTLALSLWATGHTDAMMLAAMMFDEKQLTQGQAERLQKAQTTTKPPTNWCLARCARHRSQTRLKPIGSPHRTNYSAGAAGI